MKKFILLVIVLVMVVGVIFAKDIRKLDGLDWELMPTPDKQRYCQGFLTGTDVFKMMMEDLGEHKNKEVQEFIELALHYMDYNSITNINRIIERVNYFYDRNPQHNDWPIQQVIIIMHKKNWWKFN